MPLISLREVSLHQGSTLLLDQVNLTIEPRERIALIGRNGMGKSTLMRLIHQEITPESGEIIYQSGVRIARLEQEVPRHTQGSIFDVIAAGLGEGLDWESQAKVYHVLSILSLSGEADFSALSGGMKRRVLLGRALVQEPDLLLLDEPTNHLDIEAILWLEKFLLQYPATLLFITHDRALLQKLATRIIELDRGILTNFPQDYSTYLTRKAELLETEARHNALFDKKLAAEEVWIRQGIKARRTRNEGRVRALERLRAVRSERRERTGQVSLAISMADRSSTLILEAQALHYACQSVPLVQDFSMLIHRGDKIGIIGPNGCGKSTLLRILFDKLQPDSGTLRRAENLKIAYFDQLREQLDPQASVADNVVEGSNTIEINGEKKHIIRYLQDFLFTPDRARCPVRVLSGGERNRLLLAKLFAKPSNLIIMDEPTNDLDAETLELLEELLINYTGTLILVSHDRAFLNNVVTSTLAFEGEGRIYEYVGGYDAWVQARRPPLTPDNKSKASHKLEVVTAPPAPLLKKLSYAEQHTLETLEATITNLEAQLTSLEHSLHAPEFYTLPGAEQKTHLQAFATLQAQLEEAMKQWEALEARRI